MNPILAALANFIQPAINYAEQKLESIGAAVLASFSTILGTLTNDQRIIAANVQAFWHAHYDAAVAAADAVAAAATPGATSSVSDKLLAVETASTAAFGEFIKEEGQEGSKVVTMTITALELAIENSLAIPPTVS